MHQESLLNVKIKEFIHNGSLSILGWRVQEGSSPEYLGVGGFRKVPSQNT